MCVTRCGVFFGVRRSISLVVRRSSVPFRCERGERSVGWIADFWRSVSFSFFWLKFEFWSYFEKVFLDPWRWSALPACAGFISMMQQSGAVICSLQLSRLFIGVSSFEPPLVLFWLARCRVVVEIAVTVGDVLLPPAIMRGGWKMCWRYYVNHWFHPDLSFLFLLNLQSSLAAARADNFYYPPEWTPDQVTIPTFDFSVLIFWHLVFWGLMLLVFQGSLNKFHGQHALRERARKLDQGILIIR